MAFFFLIIYAVALLIRPHEWGPGSHESSITKYSLILCMIVFLIFNKGKKNLEAPQLTLMLLFTFAVAFSLISIGWFGGAVEYGEIFVTSALIPFILVSGVLDSPKKQLAIFIVIITAAVIMVINGHTQMISTNGVGIAGNRFYRVGQDERITYLGFFGDPNDLGMFLVMTIPIIFWLKNKVNVTFQAPFWLMLAAMLYGIYMTNSRGTLLATLALTTVWLWRKYGMVKSLWAGLAISPGLLLVMAKFRSISAADESSQGRLDAWYEGFEMFRYKPFFGIGNGQFLDYHNQTAHNSFVLVFAELGLFGALLWTSLFVTTVYLLMKVSKREFIPADLPLNDNRMSLAIEESKIAMTLLYSFLGFMVAGFFLSRAYAPLLYLFLGMAAASYGRARRLFPEAPPLYDTKHLAVLTTKVTFALIVVIYTLMKIGL